MENIPVVNIKNDKIEIVAERQAYLLFDSMVDYHIMQKVKSVDCYEVIRVGFSRLWKDKNYQAIVNIAERLPESTIQEAPKLLMYYDISLGKV